MDPIEYLFGLEFHGHKFGLDNIRAITAALGSPHLAFRTVSVAGTNGKGSVCAMAATALTAAGYRTGLYTSPHMVRLEERFAVDGVTVTRAELDAAIDRVRAAIAPLLAGGGLRAQPTFFEVATAAAFVLFADRRVDIAVLEVGLGGRLDATTVASPDAGAITSIDLDHQAYLGPTIEAIAAEKAGIAKPGMPLVCGERKPEAVTVIERVCRESRAQFVDAWDGVRMASTFDAGRATITVQTPRRSYPPCTLALPGRHQAANALVTIRLLEAVEERGSPVPVPAVVAGLTQARWPARLEMVRLGGGRRALIDAAHNPAGAGTLAAHLGDVFPAPVPLVYGAMQDKDIDGCLRPLLPRVSLVVATLAPSHRAASPEAIRAAVARLAPDLPVVVEADPARALACAFGASRDICVAGSIYLLGAIVPLLAADGHAA